MRNKAQLIEDTKPFPDSIIEQLPAGEKRPALDFVSWTHYTQRLLLQHGGHTYRVTHLVYGGDLWTVGVEIVLSGDESYAGVGTDADPLNAESNAYKRACAHAGIGLHLYGSFWLHDRLQQNE